VKRARRWLRAAPRVLRWLLALRLGSAAALWLAFGAEPPALRAAVGGVELIGALLLPARRTWRLGAALSAASLLAGFAVHASRGQHPLPLGVYLASCLLLLVHGALMARSAQRLAGSFESAAVPNAAFDHAAHLTVALYYVRRLGPQGALQRLRRGLLHFLAAQGKPPDAYHETITQAWLRVVAHLSSERAAASLGRVLEELVDRFGDARLLQRHYSAERLRSPEARRSFVEPDRLALPPPLAP